MNFPQFTSRLPEGPGDMPAGRRCSVGGRGGTTASGTNLCRPVHDAREVEGAHREEREGTEHWYALEARLELEAA